MLNLTLNKRKANPEQIAKKIESTRSDYLRDLSKLRKRYAPKFEELSAQYREVCLLND